ncbi:hypothetical protein J5834_04920 [bacterium]|nr:hypothetical protein [bacterium]
MKTTKILALLLVLVSCGLAVSIYGNRTANAEIAKLQEEQIELLSAHQECLEFKEKTLRVQLFSGYLDSIMATGEKIERGEKLTPENIRNFTERSTYILDNIETLEVSVEEKTIILTVIAEAKQKMEKYLKGETPEEKKEDKE